MAIAAIGAPCDDGDSCSAEDACTASGTCVGVAPVEACNGKDDDCDGATDEPGALDCGLRYAVGDGDLIGGASQCVCDATPALPVVVGGDCNDADAQSAPGLPELCNGKDEDCDGKVDEGFDMKSDPDHCGQCGLSCGPGAGGVELGCVAGTCNVIGCPAGSFDLDGVAATGCEAVAATLYVDAAAKPGGNGAKVLPFVAIAPALKAAAPGTDIVVADGKYAPFVVTKPAIAVRASNPGKAVVPGPSQSRSRCFTKPGSRKPSRLYEVCKGTSPKRRPGWDFRPRRPKAASDAALWVHIPRATQSRLGTA